MKITEMPLPTPPPPVTYVVEFTFDELVALGLLSHRHEFTSRTSAGPTFLDCLPAQVRGEATRLAVALNKQDPSRTVGSGGTVINVDWKVEP